MTGKRLFIALSAAVALGLLSAGSVAQASSDHENQSGGYKIGPLGQRFGPVRARGFGFAYVPHWHWYRRHHYEYYR